MLSNNLCLFFSRGLLIPFATQFSQEFDFLSLLRHPLSTPRRGGRPCDTVGVALDASPIVLTRSESDYSKVRQWSIEIVQQIKEGGGAAAILSPSRGGNAPRNLIGNEKTMLALLFSLFAQQRLLDCLLSISRSSWLHAPRWTRVMGRGPNPCYCLIQFTRKLG